MKSYPAPPIPEPTIAAMRQLVDAGATQSELIVAMREAGLSIIPSIKLLIRFYGLSPSEAKSAVHLSETWADCRESNDALHESALQAAKQAGVEQATVNIRQEVTR